MRGRWIIDKDKFREGYVRDRELMEIKGIRRNLVMRGLPEL